jgi:3-oxoadipate enol-lactonase
VQAGGVRLAYRTWGPAGAPPVVLLHALGDQSSDWAPIAAALAPSWRVYAPDLRGHGASDWPGSYTIEQLTTDLAAFLDALGLNRVTLAGHSIGGPPAYLYAARHPDRVARLVLEEPAPPWPRAPRVLDRPAGPLPFDWAATALSNDFTDPQVSAWRESVRHVQAPALLVAGGPASHVDQGQLTGLAALIPECELVTIPAGHLVHAVRPAEFTAVVTDFLRDRDGKSGQQMPEHVTVRPATAADARSVAKIWHSGWHDGHAGHVPDALAAARTEPSFHTRASQRVADTTVAVVNDEVAGFIMVVGDEVEQVYVAREPRGAGAAAALLAEAEAIVAGHGHQAAWLAVVPGNARARRFYERNGWSDRGVFSYPAATGGDPVLTPAHRYEKPLRPARPAPPGLRDESAQ